MAFAATAGTVGCEDKSPDDSTPVAPVRQGDIGAVTFTYACAGPGDAQCNVDSDLAPPAKDSSFPPIGCEITVPIDVVPLTTTTP